MHILKTFLKSAFFFRLKENIYSASSSFIKENPALVYGLFFMAGVYAKIDSSFLPFLLPFFVKGKKLKAIFFILVTLGFIYTKIYYPEIPNFEKKEQISGIFKISAITPYTSFVPGLIYKGRMQITTQNGKTYKNIPVSIFYKKNDRPKGNFIYKIQGTASTSLHSQITVKAENWIPLKKTFNFVELRFALKEKARHFLLENIKHSESANFLIGLITGELNDKFLRFCFNRVGLQHILAISGFHFGILVLIFSFILKKFVPYLALPYVLIVIINLYFLYIGNSPSILRSYVSLQIAILAKILNKRSFGLNALGVSLIVELIIDPYNLTNVGFQLSFLSVMALLLFYPEMSKMLSYIFLKRNKEDLKALNILSKAGSFFINFLREALSITLAVNLALLPVLLLLFHKFPVFSLLYNLFFPPLIFVSIILLFPSFIFSFFLPSFANFINMINTAYTKLILTPLLHPPACIEFWVRFKSFSFYFIVLYLIAYFYLGIMIKYRSYSLAPKAFDYF